MLHIKSPGLTTEQIEALILKKSSWIRDALQRHHALKGRLVPLDTVEEIWIVGRRYTLKYKQDANLSKTQFVFKGELLSITSKSDELALRAIKRHYKKVLEPLVYDCVRYYSTRYNLYPKKLHFRATKRQWGSCSYNDNLSFNIMLAKAPKECIEYVVAHELCHIRHKNHSKDFWDLLGLLMPDYKQRALKLKEFIP